jgi:hypothetical protein
MKVSQKSTVGVPEEYEYSTGKVRKVFQKSTVSLPEEYVYSSGKVLRFSERVR